MLKNTFKLEKLKIKVFSKRRRKETDYIDTFEVMFNPESYSLNYENTYDSKQGLNSSGKEVKYLLSKPSQLSLKLLFDDTGVADYGLYGRKDVYTQVKKFRELTTKMAGKEHEPYFLIIHWSRLYFKCRLKSFDVKYTLFNRSGEPIRAELDALFVSDLDDYERVRLENKSSPDLTHTKTVKAGDKLPLMAQEVYGNSAYYIQLARANNLNNIRKLKTGITINLPPIEK
ncbi:hypothetical protein [Moorena sp. SIO3A2]|uniref:CIS tube protein n=1 Tax=Moorena sp. SIO3A2 TaxID=2607841 RepID=UPI0013BCC89C|nr:hypothetical protein [Moorena sp. SIO3A2]NER86345.1 hypothetical protein [Moorena sp. SIO3A2]